MQCKHSLNWQKRNVRLHAWGKPVFVSIRLCFCHIIGHVACRSLSKLTLAANASNFSVKSKYRIFVVRWHNLLNIQMHVIMWKGNKTHKHDAKFVKTNVLIFRADLYSENIIALNSVNLSTARNRLSILTEISFCHFWFRFFRNSFRF